MQQLANKFFIFLVTVCVIFSSFPSIVLAQQAFTSTDPGTYNPQTGVTTISGGQALAATGNNTTGGGTSPSYANAGVSALACTAKDLISGVMNHAIANAVSSLSTAGENTVYDMTKVPVNAGKLNEIGELTKNATVGFTIPFTNYYTGVSLDSIAYCIVNTMIEWIANSTIQWANSGFNGNPAFLDNSNQFFKSMGDNIAGNLIQGIVSDATNGGLDVCKPFRVQIGIGLASGYGGGRTNPNACTIDKIISNFQGFYDGNFSQGGWTGWFAMTQNQQNNPIGMTLLANDELYSRISAQNNTLKFDLGLNRGFLNYQKCDEPGNPDSCHTTTPGLVIQTELEKTMGLEKDRLNLATKFDQVVTALVNNLIKVGLNEVLQKK